MAADERDDTIMAMAPNDLPNRSQPPQFSGRWLVTILVGCSLLAAIIAFFFRRSHGIP
jgi:hypothetical protein